MCEIQTIVKLVKTTTVGLSVWWRRRGKEVKIIFFKEIVGNPARQVDIIGAGRQHRIAAACSLTKNIINSICEICTVASAAD